MTVTKFMVIKDRYDSDFIAGLNALADDGWTVVDSGYTQETNKNHPTWWAVLRKDTD